MNPYRSLLLFVIALAVRLLVGLIPYDPLTSGGKWGDSREVFLNSKHLTLEFDPFHTGSVWGHNPGYLLFCHCFRPVVFPLQAILGAATCCVVEALYPWGGWALAFSPDHVWASREWGKPALVGFLLACIWWLGVRFHPCLIPLGFVALVPAFFSLVAPNISSSLVTHPGPPWDRVCRFWGPWILKDAPRLVLYASYLLGVVWIGGVFALFRWTPLDSLEMGFLVVLTVCTALTFGTTSLRLNFIPLLIGMITKAVLYGIGHYPHL